MINCIHYLKFFLFHALTSFAIYSIWLGGHWLLTGFLVFVGVLVIGDVVLGTDLSTPKFTSRWPFTLQLWMAFPFVILLVLASQFQFGQSPYALLGNVSAPTSEPLLWLVGIVFTGLLIGSLATITAHELVHRRWGCFSHQIGRWMMAFSFDSSFAIEHVYGHHINIATEKDPASAPRGRNVYQHIYRSTLYGNISAWEIEKTRLEKLNVNTVSWQNRFLQGVLMSFILMLFSYLVGGLSGVLFFTASGLTAKALLEVVNYMEHYGLVRVPGKRVFPKHSWNTNTKISSWAMFNLTRHAHHHANANVPFQLLKPIPDAPTMPSGYLGTMMLTLVPPLWFKLMQPKLAQWDQQYADSEELALLQKQ